MMWQRWLLPAGLLLFCGCGEREPIKSRADDSLPGHAGSHAEGQESVLSLVCGQWSRTMVGDQDHLSAAVCLLVSEAGPVFRHRSSSTLEPLSGLAEEWRYDEYRMELVM